LEKWICPKINSTICRVAFTLDHGLRNWIGIDEKMGKSRWSGALILILSTQILLKYSSICWKIALKSLLKLLAMDWEEQEILNDGFGFSAEWDNISGVFNRYSGR
jgi:hypothetical protein